jgi:hypothetical protein
MHLEMPVTPKCCAKKLSEKIHQTQGQQTQFISENTSPRYPQN